MMATAESTRPMVRVLYDYEYKNHAGEQITFKKGTEFKLLKQSNEEWWAVASPEDKKPRFVPANYVEIIQKVEPDKKVKKKPPPPKPPKPKLPQPALDHDTVIKQFDQMLDTLVPIETDNEEDKQSDIITIVPSKEEVPVKVPDMKPKTPEEQPPSPVSTFLVGKQDALKSSNGSVSTDNNVRPSSMFLSRNQGVPHPSTTASLDRTKLVRAPEQGHVRSSSASAVPVSAPNGEVTADTKRPKAQPRTTNINYNNEIPTYANLDEIQEHKLAEDESKETKPTDQSCAESKVDKEDESGMSVSKGGDKLSTQPKEIPDDEIPNYANLSTIQAHIHQSKRPAPPPPPSGSTPLRYLEGGWCLHQDTAGQPFYFNSGTGKTSWDLPGQPTSGPAEVSEADDTLPKIPGMVNIMKGSIPGTDKTLDDVNAHYINDGIKVPVVKEDRVSGSSDDVFNPEEDTHIQSLQNTSRIREMQTMLNRTKISENGKKVKKNWSVSFVVTTGPYMYFYRDQKSTQPKPNMPVGKYEAQIDLRGACVGPAPKELTSKKNVIMLTTASNVQFLLQSDDKARMDDFASTIKNNITMLGHRPDALELPGQTDRPPDSPSVAHGNKTKRPSKREKSSTLERPTTPDDGEKGKIKDWLLYWLLRRPTAETLKERGIIKDRIFGSHLQSICDREKSVVPRFAQHCIHAVEKRGLTVDGIYRISGNMAAIQKLRFKVDSNETFDLLTPEWDIHDISGALKLFFRELQEPLYPFSLYNKFTKASQILNRQLKLKAFQDLVKELPKTNFSTIKELFCHLRRVVEHSKENRMEAQNVAIVFGPTLMRPQEEGGNMAANLVMQGQIVEYMILQYKALF